MDWYNPPTSWQATERGLMMTCGPDTDFWRVTRHNFIADNAPFYYEEVTGDFTVTVKITAAYASQYDQAGLMLRENERVWMKCGVEYLDGVQQAGAVVTREYSDWSVLPLPENPPSVWIRVLRIAEAIEVSYSTDGAAFTMLREAYLTPTPTLQVGMMAAAPKGPGFDITFEDYTLAMKGAGA
jgi:regulation of enolase protein 1 (concanavalin A-like superfamily)